MFAVKALQGNCSPGAGAAAFCSLQGQILLAPEGDKPTDGQSSGMRPLKRVTSGEEEMGKRPVQEKTAEALFPPEQHWAILIPWPQQFRGRIL